MFDLERVIYAISTFFSLILFARFAYIIRLEYGVERSWAQYSPYFPVAQYVVAPSTCEVVQVNILQRHGARFPTSGSSARIKAAVAKLKAARTCADSTLTFLKNYTYDLGSDDLVELGALESSQAGGEVFSRYKHLISQKRLPFVRASGSNRVVLSALNWTAGFTRASHSRHKLEPPLVIPENLNNTLDDKMCPNAGDGDSQTSQWLSTYALAIAARLNEAAPGANLTSEDVYSLISLCPFETVAKGVTSPFCGLFSEKEFEAFEYSGDLDKYYGTGYGQALGRVQGVGFVNELLARLTGLPVQDETQTNRTLDSSPETFPLDRRIYADFSHDNQMIAIFSAIGLFVQPAPLDPLFPDFRRTWVVARMVPFAGRMVVEKLECQRHGEESKEYVRILVNDKVQPLLFCGASLDGLCLLEHFLKSQDYARSNGRGDFDKCGFTGQKY